MTSLLLCLSQQRIYTPYQFKLTNIKVYSVEEALYHAYHYWKESLDDVVSREFLNWVSNDLGLPFITEKIKDIDPNDSLSVRMIKFFGVIDYFDEDELGAVHEKLSEWENRLEWERLKDRGDYFNGINQPSKAYPFYLRAIHSGENADLLNNAGVCLMKLNKPGEAAAFLERALEYEPSRTQILKNYIEALIYDLQFERASACISELETRDDRGDISYLYGELCFGSGNIFQAANHYEKAAASGDDIFMNHRLAEIYVRLRFFDKALDVMNRVHVKDEIFLMKQADIYRACNNLPAAVRCVERALLTNKTNAKLWVMLAQLYRLNYDNARAEMSIHMALDIEPDNEEAMLENARIKKLSGKTREYQIILKSILNNFKKRYRDISKEINI